MKTTLKICVLNVSDYLIDDTSLCIAPSSITLLSVLVVCRFRCSTGVDSKLSAVEYGGLLRSRPALQLGFRGLSGTGTGEKR